MASVHAPWCRCSRPFLALFGRRPFGRTYTFADIGPSVIGDPQRVADHVRYAGDRVVAMPSRSNLALRRELDGITCLTQRRVPDHFFRLTVTARRD